MDITQLIIGLVLAACIAYAAFQLKALNKSGGWAAFGLGTLVFGLGGFAWALVLMVFFITSSGLSLLFKKRKTTVEEKYAKGSRRDARQVLANGGLAGAAVIAHVLFPTSILPWVAFSAVFAAANADTWATELGVLNRTSPRLIHTGKVVPAGTSGGVSLAGMLAAAAGSMIVAATTYIFWPLTGLAGANRLLLSLLIVVAGFLGSIVDSVIGATVQGVYWCSACQKETEKYPLHSCGNATTLLRGKRWITNDWVNLLCTGSASALMIIATLLFL
ncbi:MAG: DUF92 domain-containing protein [Anaerolineaceae bacterium]|nr:DUF92 domain-containing protein [Anaerolineaceae bacterium]